MQSGLFKSSHVVVDAERLEDATIFKLKDVERLLDVFGANTSDAEGQQYLEGVSSQVAEFKAGNVPLQSPGFSPSMVSHEETLEED